jgi:hypothetical protein
MAGEVAVMKRHARFISIAGMLTLGLAAVPVLAADLPQTAQAEESAAAPLHAGQDLFDQALDQVQLRPDQKTAVEAMKAEAEKRHAPVKAAKGQFLLAMADQVEKGDLDRCALASSIKGLASAVAEAHPGDRADFEKLHSLLDPAQRTAFVAALKQLWQSHEKMHEPAALADKMAKELSLSTDQKTSVEKILTGLHEVREAEPWHAEHHARWTKILDAFSSDNFALDQVAPMGDVAAHTTKKVEGMLWAKEAILPVLSSDQRKTVADKIRERAKGAAPASRSMGPAEEE